MDDDDDDRTTDNDDRKARASAAGLRERTVISTPAHREEDNEVKAGKSAGTDREGQPSVCSLAVVVGWRGLSTSDDVTHKEYVDPTSNINLLFNDCSGCA